MHLLLLAVTTLVIIASAGTAVAAQAAYIATATETGGDVVFDGSGTLDLTAWSFGGNRDRVAFVDPDSAFAVGATRADDYINPANFSGPSTIGSGTSTTKRSSSAGDYTGINFQAQKTLFVAGGYTSGQSLAGSETFTGQTFSSLGVTPGTYEWT